jgi:hypothetical protein
LKVESKNNLLLLSEPEGSGKIPGGSVLCSNSGVVLDSKLNLTLSKCFHLIFHSILIIYILSLSLLIQMSGEPSPRKEKRAIPYVSPEGEKAFHMAARVVGSGKSSRGKATPRMVKGGGSISGSRGMNVVPQVVDNGGSEGKTIPVEVDCAIPMAQIDISYLVHHRSNPKKRPPTKYDNSFTFEHRNYEGLGNQVKMAREENPYASPKLATIDYIFWCVFHF